MLGTMNMLRCNEKEGLVYETGWQNEGVWNYFGSFYAHAWLWLGDGEKAAKTMIAMANHASPTLVWREEQPLKTSTSRQMTGDMPHNWASAEFVRMVRNFIVFERGNELHLFEAVPPTWTKPGMVTALKDVVTEFGKITVSLEIAGDGASAKINASLESNGTPAPAKILVHMQGISGKNETVELPGVFPVDKTIGL